MIHYMAPLHSIRYVIVTKYYCCHIKPDVYINAPWELCGYSDADYTGDNDTCESVTRYIVIINRAVIDWSFLIQKKVSLSVTESWY